MSWLATRPDSVVKVVRGEKLTELQALLVPSHRYMFTARAMG